ncbi:hypothetical protein [Burkholderia sp. BCC0322]|uniref:hypothetical protein n=1 Tax=unclassified Burkholderia TaxID=2613784 RepID=UPI001589142D|nr:hypothetical protein [Burkholderia sp. BCC0322]
MSILVGGEWIKTFSWSKGCASFNARRNLSAVDPTMAAAMHLAVALSAVVRGDEGELYPLAG